MKIETTVKIKESADRCDLYTLFTLAAQGDYKKDIESGDTKKIEAIEKMIKSGFDNFATYYFNLGIEHEKGQHNRG